MHGLNTLRYLNDAKIAQEILKQKDPNAEAKRLQQTLDEYIKAKKYATV
jgi:hypothetical protein